MREPGATECDCTMALRNNEAWAPQREINCAPLTKPRATGFFIFSRKRMLYTVETALSSKWIRGHHYPARQLRTQLLGKVKAGTIKCGSWI